MSDVTTVRALLGAAGLPASDTEIEAYSSGFPGLRAGLDMLHNAAGARYIDPALRFRAESRAARAEPDVAVRSTDHAGAS